MKIRPMGTKFLEDGQTDGRTNMTKLIVAFRNFTNATKNLLEGKIFGCKSHTRIMPIFYL